MFICSTINNMSSPDSRTREEQVADTIDEHFREQYNIVDSRISLLSLGPGMVVRIGGRLKVVASVCYEQSGSGPIAVVETSSGFETLASDSEIDVWYIEGKPFIMALPQRISARAYVPPTGNRGPTSSSHDAAGIVPVWRGPKRYN